jgi:hypothetical protein
MDKLVRSETPVMFFKELVEKAMARQGFVSSELSSYYLVQLLDNFVSADDLYVAAELDKNLVLAEILADALQSEGGRRFTLLKFTGDLALFISGFFSDSIARRRVDLDYYVRMGGYAYGHVARLSPSEAAEVFLELSTKFGRFVDVLNEVSEESGIADVAGILRLYEKWLQTGSKRSEALLRREGIQLGPSSRITH